VKRPPPAAPRAAASAGLLLAAGLALPGAPPRARAAELTPEQRKAMVEEHYRRAFDQVKKGDYGRALRHWESILELDPTQKSPKALIEEGRRKVGDQTRDQERQVYDRIDRGEYRKAYEGLLALLDRDPSHPGYLALTGRLERVSGILPEAGQGAGHWRVVRTALGAYLGRTEDLKLAYDGLRHARDLAPEDPKVKTLLEDFEGLHREVVQANRVTPGMKLLEYKQFIVLGHIYDGKYPQAIEICHEVLALEPEDILTLKRMGSSYYAMGQKARAREIWARAIKLSPADAQLKSFLAKVASSSASDSVLPEGPSKGGATAEPGPASPEAGPAGARP